VKKILRALNYSCECASALTPIQGINRCKNKASLFKWQTQLSSSRLKINKVPKIPGWYMLEIDILSEKEYLDLTVYLIDNRNTHHYKEHPALIVSGRVTKRVVYLPPTITEIQLSPAEVKTSLTVKSIKFVKLQKSAAIKFMHKKLLTYRPDKEYKHTLQLWRHYQRLFKQQQKTESDYGTWIEKREYNLLKQEFHLKSQTLLVVVMTINDIDDTEITINRLNSLLQQTYTNWELIVLTDGRKLNQKVKTCLSGFTDKVKLIKNSLTNSLTSTIELLQYSKSDHYLYLSETSILSKYALSVISRSLQKKPEVSIVYADNDTIDAKGNRKKPEFKPDWNPDFVLSKNYIGENFVIHRNFLEKCRNINIDNKALWVYEIIIKASLSNISVKHIPLILSHQLNVEAINNYNNEKERLVILNKYLKPSKGLAVRGKDKKSHKVSWEIPQPLPLVSIIIPTRDGLDTLKRAVDSVLSKTKYNNFEILIIDNQSKKRETLNYLRKLNTHIQVKVLSYDAPFNYSAINNYAVEHANGSIITLLNNDVEVISPNWLHEMVSHSLRQDIGCVGAMLYYPDNRIQHAGVILGLGGCAGHSHKFYRRGDKGYQSRLFCTQNYSAVTAACLTVEKSIFKKVNGLNEKHLSIAFNDVDFCLKVQAAGYRNLWTPWAELYHFESVSRGKDDTKVKRLRLNSEVAYMKDTWNTTTINDPYYNKFLTRIREDFSLGL
jgi:GT2 family glycosyltransferase